MLGSCPEAGHLPAASSHLCHLYGTFLVISALLPLVSRLDLGITFLMALYFSSSRSQMLRCKVRGEKRQYPFPFFFFFLYFYLRAS